MENQPCPTCGENTCVCNAEGEGTCPGCGGSCNCGSDDASAAE